MEATAILEANLGVLKIKIFDNILRVFALLGMGISLFLYYENNFSFAVNDYFVFIIVTMALLLYFFKNKLSFEVKILLFYLLGLLILSLGMYYKGLFSMAPLFVIFISSFLSLYLSRKKVYFIFFSYLVLYIFFTYYNIQNNLIHTIEIKHLVVLMGPVRGVVIFFIAFSLIKIVEYYNELLIMNYLTIQDKNLQLKEYHDNLEKIVKDRTKELEQSLIREKELGILKTNFISMASHEFRTPLTSIQALIELVLNYSDRLTIEQIKERLIKINVEVSNMTNMLEDVLIIGQVDSDKIVFTPVELNLVEFVKEIIFEYQLFKIAKREVDFQFVSDEIVCNVDIKLMKQIVINLFSNALKYSEFPKPILVSVLKENNNVIFSVTDQGIGISNKEQKLIFEPFFRANNVENIPGTGLGLTIIERAVNMHNGKIEVLSKLGKGTTFRIVLPCDN